MKSFRRSATYLHPIEDVWAGLTDRHALAEWLMPTTFTEPTVGTQFRFQYDPSFMCPAGIVDCEVLESEPPRRMVWSWRNRAREGAVQMPAMRVEWLLTEVAKGTRVELVQSQLEGQPWLIPFAMGVGWSLYFRKYLPRALRNINAGKFMPGAIPLPQRAYRATNLPHDVTV